MKAYLEEHPDVTEEVRKALMAQLESDGSEATDNDIKVDEDGVVIE